MLSKRRMIGFVLVSLCFALWGIANEMNILIKPTLGSIFMMNELDAQVIEYSFCGSYFLMALPAAIYTWSTSFKSGITLGLVLYAFGAFLFYPAAQSGEYMLFCIANFVLAAGLSFLETSANPYILTLGSEKHALFRLNLAQSFNSLGWLMGFYLAINVVQKNIFGLSPLQRLHLDPIQFRQVRDADLQLVSSPYLWIGVAVVILAVIIGVAKIPEEHEMKPMYYYDEESDVVEDRSFWGAMSRLVSNRRYNLGFIAQFFYVGCQILCWSYIVDYSKTVLTANGYTEQMANATSGNMMLLGFVLFALFRIISTFVIRVVQPSILLGIMATLGVVLTVVAYVLFNVTGMYILVGMGACMSLMFPTIYGIALSELDLDMVKVGAAGQIMAIFGGTAIPLAVHFFFGNSVFGGCSMAVCMAVILAFSIWVIREEKKWKQIEN